MVDFKALEMKEKICGLIRKTIYKIVNYIKIDLIVINLYNEEIVCKIDLKNKVLKIDIIKIQTDVQQKNKATDKVIVGVIIV